MAQSGQSARWGGSAALWGGVTGLLLALIIVGARVLAGSGLRARVALVEGHAGPVWLRGLVVLLALLAFFLAGLFAARSTRRIEAGIVAGLLAGAISGAAAALVTLLTAVAVGRRLPASVAGRFPHALVGAGVVRGVAVLIVVTLVATGVGTLGGLLGRGRNPQTRGNPYDAPPAYPGYSSGYSPSAAQAWPPTPSYGSNPPDTVPGTSQVYPSPSAPDDSGTRPASY